MKLLSKIRAAGLSLLLVLSAGSLVQAAAPVDKAVVKDLVRSQRVMAKERYVQYEMKGTLFSPIGVGNLTLTGNGVEETDKKNTRVQPHRCGEPDPYREWGGRNGQKEYPDGKTQRGSPWYR